MLNVFSIAVLIDDTELIKQTGCKWNINYWESQLVHVRMTSIHLDL